ncbi:MAG TPA: hypothetical protein VIZ58_12990 [Thermoanaerobaculia bacterium]
MDLAEVVGRLTALQRFPVEPLSGEVLNAAPVSGAGLVGDRAYDICDADGGAPIGFADAPLLLFYTARYVDELLTQNLDTWTRIRTPAGVERPIGDPGWLPELAAFLGRDLSLEARRPSGEAPLRLISRGTLRLAERTYGATLEPVRVRANLVVDITEGKPFDEESWIGHRIGIGDTLLEIVACANDAFVAGYRPEVAAGDADMLEGFLRLREGRLGVTARAVSGSRIRTGDPVALLD